MGQGDERIGDGRVRLGYALRIQNKGLLALISMLWRSEGTSYVPLLNAGALSVLVAQCSNSAQCAYEASVLLRYASV